MKKCPKCKTNLNDKAKFCSECGCNIKEFESKRLCPNCGTEVPTGKFCTECGTKIEETLKNEYTNSNIDLAQLISIADEEIHRIERQLEKFKYIKLKNDKYKIIGAKVKELSQIDLPEEVIEIGRNAFENVTIESFTMPKSIKEIGEDAFKDSKIYNFFYSGSPSDWLKIKFRNINSNPIKNSDDFYMLDESDYNRVESLIVNEDINEFQFVGLKDLKELNLSNSVQIIKQYAFHSCINLKTILEFDKLSEIKNNAFENCKELNIDLPKNIKLGDNSIKDTKLEIEEKNKQIEEEKKEILNKRKTQFDIDAFIRYRYFGRYPQTKVIDKALIKNLNQITTINEYGYIEYDGNEYKKYDGKYKEYNNNYYLVEPIKWRILETYNNSYKLVSDLILDQQMFYSSKSSRTINGKTIYANNYEYSDIRAWLNNDFINTAFNTEEQNIINESLVDNSASTTSSNTNKYACNNTNDKIYLLSYKDVTEKYFTTDSERQAKATDYADEKGVSVWDDYSEFWLRSPCHYMYSNYVDSVYSVGKAYNTFCSYGIGARPALEIKIK